MFRRFCLEGGKQLEFDIKTGIFPIFGEFTEHPESYFTDLLVSSIHSLIDENNNCLLYCIPITYFKYVRLIVNNYFHLVKIKVQMIICTEVTFIGIPKLNMAAMCINDQEY